MQQPLSQSDICLLNYDFHQDLISLNADEKLTSQLPYFQKCH